MPRDTEWRALRELLATHPARVMLWEDAPAPAVAERLAALGVECVVYAPSPNRPDAGDWLSVMRANVRRLADASLDASAS
jgi:zinc transport system substrate-binding protein